MFDFTCIRLLWVEESRTVVAKTCGVGVEALLWPNLMLSGLCIGPISAYLDDEPLGQWSNTARMSSSSPSPTNLMEIDIWTPKHKNKKCPPLASDAPTNGPWQKAVGEVSYRRRS